MAASAIASLPFKSFFMAYRSFLALFFHGDRHIGAHRGAERASDAAVQILAVGGVIALFVQVRCIKLHNVLGARVHTQGAALAHIFVYGNNRHTLTSSIQRTGASKTGRGYSLL
jgi:hypothetical protein